MPIFKKINLIFIHIPKNAGTSVLTSISKNVKHFNVKDYNWPCNGHATALCHKKAFPKLWKKMFKCAIVRNPWARLVSCYKYATLEESFWHQTIQTNNKPIHPDFLLLKDKTFEETINILQESPQLLKHPGWGPQYKFICDENKNIIIDKIFFYEQLKQDKDFIKLFPDIPHINSTNSENYTTYYKNSDIIEFVSNFYKIDIELFGYNFSNS